MLVVEAYRNPLLVLLSLQNNLLVVSNPFLSLLTLNP
jgi:hypothetical protein